MEISFQNTSLYSKGIGKGKNNNNNYNNGVPGPADGVEKERFQQTRSTHPGAEENETLNKKVMRKKHHIVKHTLTIPWT